MSNDSKANDIDDVLASIRKLVTENAQAAQDRDALVLTSNHMVSGAPQLANPTAVSGHKRQEPSIHKKPNFNRVSAGQKKPPLMNVSSLPDLDTSNLVKPSVTKPASETVEPQVKPRFASKINKTYKTSEIPEETKEYMAEAAETDALEVAINHLETVFSEADEFQEWGEEPVVESEHATLPSSVNPSDIQAIDLDDLRPIISELVREELRGSLGEKITRNVRKLVRREIQRALTAQSLD